VFSQDDKASPILATTAPDRNGVSAQYISKSPQLNLPDKLIQWDPFNIML
jgi:hypothetical protein